VLALFPVLFPISFAHGQAIAIAKIERDLPVDFQKEILPILKSNCLACHNAAKAEGELVLETPRTIAKGGSDGPVVAPRDGAKSRLLDLASHGVEPFMPPEGNKVGAKPLSPEQLGLIKLWIDQGAAGEVVETSAPIRWRPLPSGLNPIYALALSPDGQFAACSRANQVFIYHVPSGRLITRLADPALARAAGEAGVADLDAVRSLAISPAGDMIASGGYRTVRLWRQPRNVERHHFAAGEAAVNAVAASADGRWIATGAADGSVQLWEVAEGEGAEGRQAATFDGHTAAVTSATFSADDASLLTASLDGSIRVWDVKDRSQTGRIDAPGAVNAIALVGDGSQLASAGPDKLIHLWSLPDRSSGSDAHRLGRVPLRISALAASADRKQLAVGGDDGRIRVVDVADGSIVRSLFGHHGPIACLAFQAGGELLASAAADGELRVWDLGNSRPMAILRGPSPADVIAMHPSGKQLATGTAAGDVTLWKLDLPPPRTLAGVSDTPPTVAVVSADGKLVASGEQLDGRPAIVVRTLETGSIARVLLGHASPVTALAFNADGTRLVSGSDDTSVRVWSLADGKLPELAMLAGHEGPVNGVAFNADATQVVSGSHDKNAIVWNVAESKLIIKLTGHAGPVVGVALAADNKTVVSASADGSVRFWNGTDGSVVRSLSHALPLVAFAQSRDGRLLAVAGADHAVKVYDVAAGTLLFTLAGHTRDVATLAFNADGSRLVSADADNRAVVWGTATGKHLESLVSAGPNGCVAFAPATQAGGAPLQAVVVAGGDRALHLQALAFERSLDGHTGAVRGLVYNADGGLLTSGCADGNLRGFQSVNGQPAFTANHGAKLHALAVSPNGQVLATAGDDKQIRLWNAANGQPGPKPQLAGFGLAVTSAAFSADGARVVGACDGEAILFDVATGDAEEIFRGFKPATTFVLAGEKGEQLISAAPADGLRVQPVLAGRRIAGHTAAITALSVLPTDATQLFSASEDGSVRQWRIVDGQPVRQLDLGGPALAMAVSADGTRLAAGGSNRAVRLWNLQNNQLLAELRGDFRAQNLVLKLTQDGGTVTNKLNGTKTQLAAAQQDLPGKTAAAKTASDALAATEKAESDALASSKTASTAKKTADAAAFEAALVAQRIGQAKATAVKAVTAVEAELKAATDKAARAKAAADADASNASLAQAKSAADKVVAEAGVKLQTAATAKQGAEQSSAEADAKSKQAADAAAATAKPATDAATAAATATTVRKNAQLLAKSMADAEKLVTDAIERGKADVARLEAALVKNQADLEAAKKAITEAEQPMRAVAFSPDGAQLAAAGDDRKVHTYHAETGVPIEVYAGHGAAVGAVTFTPSAALVSGSGDASAVVWEMDPDWALERTIGAIDDPSQLADRVLAIDFSPDGALLATAGGEPARSGELKLWNVADGKLALAISEAHHDTIFSVDFSADGKYLATGGADKAVRVFEAADGRQVKLFEGHTHHVLGVSWRSDGRLLVSCGADTAVKVWDFESGEQQRSLNFSPKQAVAVQFVGDTTNALVTSGDNLLRLFQAENGGLIRNYDGAGGYVHTIAVTPDGKLVAAGGEDGVLRLFNGENTQRLKEFAPPKSKE
jgi:WD40 repeat protein